MPCAYSMGPGTVVSAHSAAQQQQSRAAAAAQRHGTAQAKSRARERASRARRMHTHTARRCGLWLPGMCFTVVLYVLSCVRLYISHVTPQHDSANTRHHHITNARTADRRPQTARGGGDAEHPSSAAQPGAPEPATPAAGSVLACGVVYCIHKYSINITKKVQAIKQMAPSTQTSARKPRSRTQRQNAKCAPMTHDAQIFLNA